MEQTSNNNKLNEIVSMFEWLDW